MDKPQLDTMIATLERIKERPTVYMASELPAVVNFLDGFYAGCAACGVKLDRRVIYDAVVIERGWRITSFGPYPSMKDKGLTDDAIVDELLAIEIETWKRVASDKANFQTVLDKATNIPLEPYDL